MPFQWIRFIADGTAGTASADTVETQLGTGIKVPNWARSLVAAQFLLHETTVTTNEDTAGYFRLANDENTLDPLNFPMFPSATLLAGSHMTIDPTVPCWSKVTPNDIIRLYFAFDSAVTTDYTVDGYLAFSSDEPPMNLHCAKSAATAAALNLTASTTVTLETIANKVSSVLGFGGYVCPSVSVAAESLKGHFLVRSNAYQFLDQQIPIGTYNSGVTNVHPLAFPVFAVDWKEWSQLTFPIHAYKSIPFKQFPLKVREAFNFQFFNDRDINDTLAPSFRAFMLWKE